MKEALANGRLTQRNSDRDAVLSPRVALIREATEQRGTANRTHRNMLVYLAADEARLEELDAATRDYVGWTHVLANEADLDLTLATVR